MVDLEGKDKGNISLPPRLQSPDVFDPDFEDDEHRLPIINMQKAFYDVQISDKEKRIKRLEDRNSELEETYADTEALIKSLDIETGDDIARLNKLISVQTSKIDEIWRNISFVEKSRAEEKEIHLRNVNSGNEKYEATRVTLTSAIKTLNAQINTLEDYKLTRDDLREKLRVREESMAENEESVTRRLDMVDRKFKVDREKLKNEMYSRLLALSGSFQMEISGTTAKPVLRLMRENIFIRNELTNMMNESLKKKEDYTRRRSVENLRSNSMKLDWRAKKSHLKTVKLQRCLIKALREKHLDLRKRLENFDMPDEFAQEKYDNLAETASLELEAFEAHRRKLEVLLHQESVKFNRADFTHRQTERRAKKYEDTLYDLKYAIACALKMTETGEDILDMNETQLASHLLHLIRRRNAGIQSLGTASTVSVPRPSDVYAKGDLGFVPKHINFEDATIAKEFSESPEASSIDVPQVTHILSSAILLEDNDGGLEDEEEDDSERSSESAVTTPSEETKGESSDEEVRREREESVNGESDGEEQE